MISLKLEYEQELHRVQVKEESLTLKSLRDLFRNAFDSLSESFRIEYTDDAGDRVVVSSEEELMEARRLLTGRGLVHLVSSPVMMFSAKLIHEQEGKMVKAVEEFANVVAEILRSGELRCETIKLQLFRLQLVEQYLTTSTTGPTEWSWGSQLVQILDQKLQLDDTEAYLVEGAGSTQVNGLYTLNGISDGCKVFSCRKSDQTYSLLRYKLPSGRRKWYISILADDGDPGQDIDFYFRNLVWPTTGKYPPLDNWEVASVAMDPAPQIHRVPRSRAITSKAYLDLVQEAHKKQSDLACRGRQMGESELLGQMRCLAEDLRNALTL